MFTYISKNASLFSPYFYASKYAYLVDSMILYEQKLPSLTRTVSHRCTQHENTYQIRKTVKYPVLDV